MKDMEQYSRRLERAKAVLERAQFILIGGGAGLSAAAGLTYAGSRFTDSFGPFIEKYGMKDMYSAGFYPFRTEERWGYWAKHILVNRYDPPAAALYLDLRKLAEKRDYFVITTNVDHQFYKAGFSPERIFAVQGDYGLNQCAAGCHSSYPNEALIREMAARTGDCRIPPELVPRCPVCGGPMAPNLRKDAYFAEDAAWHEARERFGAFAEKAAEGRLVLLELGVGYNTPGIIRFPFEEMVRRSSKTALVRVNRDYPCGPEETRERTISFSEDMAGTVAALLGRAEEETA